MNARTLILLFVATTASAYEVETHGLMTLEAFNASMALTVGRD